MRATEHTNLKQHKSTQHVKHVEAHRITLKYADVHSLLLNHTKDPIYDNLSA